METEEQFQARLQDWTRRKQAGEVFPGPMPRRGDGGVFGGEGAPNPMIDSTAPGASLDTQQPDADRTRLGGYLEQLTTQAQTGGGAWEQALAQNTNATQQTAEALGQTAGLDPMNANRNIGNAQAGAEQRAVGQGNLLRAQTQQQAQGQLADVLGGQGALDAQQGASALGAEQARRAMDEQMRAQKNKEGLNYLSSTVQGLGTGAGAGKAHGGEIDAYSEGGTVPGQPEVFGDTSVNDTVPAKLTPQEIVLPLSVTMAPDAPAQAAAFVAAIKARGPQQGQEGFAPGGEVGDAFTAGRSNLANPSTLSPVKEMVSDPIASGPYNETRDASLANSNDLLAGYLGKGPSTAPQAMQNATDSTIADAMRAQAGSRKPLDVTGAATEQSQGAAGNAAGIVAGESQRAGETFANAVQRQRAQDLAFATAQQQAAWRNTMMNAGVSLTQQNELKNLLGSAGQGAVAASSMFGPGKGYDSNDMSLSGGPIYDPDMGKAYGGEIGYTEGGVVAHLARQGTRRAPARPVDKRSPVERWADSSDGRQEPVASKPTPTRQERMEESARTPRDPDADEFSLAFYEGGGVPGEGQSIIQRLLAGFREAEMPRSRMSLDRAALPEPQGVTQAQLAESLRSPRDASGAAMPPPQAHGPTARERPFIASPTPTPQKPAPAPGRPAVGGSAPGAPKTAPADLQQQAAAGTRDTAIGLADEQTRILTDGQRANEAAAIDQRQRAAQAESETETALNDLRQTSEDLRRVDTEVDTGRFFSSRSTGGKILAILGLAMGAVGNDNGNNRAAMLLNQLVDRDIDAQKASHELTLRKGQAAVSGAQTYYSMMRQKGLDSQAAGLAAKVLATEKVSDDLRLALAKAGAPMAKAAYAQTLAENEKTTAKTAAALKQTLFENNLKARHLAIEQQNANTAAAAAGAKAQGVGFVAPGYALKEGARPKPEELEKWRAARAGADDVKAKALALKEMIEGNEKTGAKPQLSGTDRFAGPNRGRAEALLGSLKVAAKEAFALGAISGSDMDLVMSQVADPTGLTGLFSKDKTMTTKLDQFIDNADATVTKKGDALGIIKEGTKPASGGQDDAGARAWLADPANATSPHRAGVQAKLGGR